MRIAIMTAACVVWVVVMGGCIHVAGVVVKMDGKPLPTAVLSIGRPTDIANYGIHKVDAAGRFDFYIGPTDETNLFVYDGAGQPAASIRQVPSDEVGGNMRIKMVPVIPDADPAINAVQ